LDRAQEIRKSHLNLASCEDFLNQLKFKAMLMVPPSLAFAIRILVPVLRKQF
jgi:hypothetical protein